MTLRLTLVAALVLLAVTVALGADLARACSCAGIDPRDRLAEGDPALIGEVTARRTLETTPGGELVEYSVRVERGFNASLGPDVLIRGETNGGACGFTWEVGERVGAFLAGEDGRWTTGLCSLVAPAELIAATKAYPRARGHGRVALLAGGSFAGARVMALDGAGRILGYGFGSGSADEISVCPGGRRAAELVRVGASATRVAVRDLRTLRVLRSVHAPHDTVELRCADRPARALFTAGIRYTRSHPLGRVRIMRLRNGRAHRLAVVAGDTTALSRTTAYVADRSSVSAIELDTGSVRRLLAYPDAGALTPSPDGSMLAVSAARHRTVVLELPGGGSVGHVSGGVPTWLPARRLLVQGTGRARLYDPRLTLVRRLPALRDWPSAAAGDRVYGVSRRRLSALDVGTGRRRLVATLPDPDTFALEPVPGAPRIRAPRIAPQPVASRAAHRRCGVQPS